MKLSLKAWNEANECLEKIRGAFADELGEILDKPVLTYSYNKTLAQSDKRRLDAHYFNPFYFSVSKRISEKKNARALTELADISRETVTNTNLEIPDPFQYIEIDGINTRFGSIEHTSPTKKASGPSRAQKVVRNGAILLSTVRPYRNAITRALKDHKGYVCSTGFSVLLPRRGTKPDFLCAFLRSPWGLKQLEQKMSNANYPALTEDWLNEVLVPDLSDEVVKKVCKTMQQMRHKLAQSDALREKAIRIVENMIQGKP